MGIGENVVIDIHIMYINTTANHMGVGENVVIDIHIMYINTTANNMGVGGCAPRF